MSTCGLLGCMEEARECVAQLRAIQPSGTVVWMSKVLKAALQRNRRAHEMWIVPETWGHRAPSQAGWIGRQQAECPHPASCPVST
jgi:hypothetical protein